MTGDDGETVTEEYTESGTTTDDSDESDAAFLVDTVNIQRAPGFEAGGFTVAGFASGVTIVHGPNGSGKTTIAHSIQSLLWPETADDRTVLDGQFSVDDDDWRIDLAAQRASYQQNGAEVNGPSLPAAEHADRYRLSLHELIQRDTRNEAFAKRIQQESIGGYDLDAAYSALEFDDTPNTRGISEHDAAVSARDAWQKARTDVQELEEEQARIPHLEAERDEAQAAQERVDLLAQAITCVERDAELDEAREALASYPDVLEDIDGPEAERVTEFTERIEQAREKLEAAQEQQSNAVAAIEAADLPDGGLSDGEFTTLRDRYQKLESLESERDELLTQLSSAEDRRSSARSDLPVDVDDETLAALDPAVWSEISEFVRNAERVQARRSAQDAISSWLGDEDIPDADRTALQNGRRALEEWLSTPAPAPDIADSEGDATAFKIGAASAGAVAASGVALGALVHPAFFGTLLVAAGLLWYAYQAKPSSDAGESGESVSTPRTTHQESFERLSLTDPTEWTTDAVRDRLEEIYDALARVRLAEQCAALTPAADQLAAEEASLAETRESLQDQYGLAPTTEAPELAAFTNGLARWKDAHDDLVGTQGKLETVENNIERTLDTLNDELAPFGYDPAADASAAAGHLQDLKERKQACDEAVKERDKAAETIENATEAIEDLTAERAEIYAACGLDDGEERQLRELVEQRADYQSAKNQVRITKDKRDDAYETFEAHHRFEPGLTDQSVQELEAKKQEAADAAARLDDIKEEITTIRTKVREAKRDSNLEEKAAKKERALENLEQRLDEDAAAMVGHTLVEHLSAATAEASRPAVFRRAQSLLTQITRGRYELLIDDATFRAKDTVRERGLALDELSSATRLQVLLAVRLAFVEQQESGHKLPLLLDETLANTDDERADAIIESMIELARDGRQVLYFTAQGDEVAKWQTALSDADGLEHSTIDLTEEREIEGGIDVPEYDALTDAVSGLPDVDAHNHESYGDALGVPAFSPMSEAGTAHIWYVVEDVELLHHLLALGISQWGQLNSLLDTPASTSLIQDAERRQAVRHNGLALEEYVESWSVGRGKRVDRTVLEESGAITETFIDRVSELATELNGDPEAIVSALHEGKVSRFQSGKATELEEYLEANGYLSQTDPLEPEVIKTRAVSQFTANGYSNEQAREKAYALFTRLQRFSSGPIS